LETFTDLKELVENPDYQVQRRQQLSTLSDSMIDEPIVELIHGFNELPYCFTLQCCYGHFLYSEKMDLYNLDPLPDTKHLGRVEYRIAYIALCIEHTNLGKMLIDILKGIADIDPENIQFGCAEWFWKRQVNSYALQVEPDRCKQEDKAFLDYEEGLKVEKIRNNFFAQLNKTLRQLVLNRGC